MDCRQPDNSKSQGSVTSWMQGIRDGDLEAGRKLYQRYFNALSRHAQRLIPRNMRQIADDEDMAIEALAALLRGLQDGRFADLSNRDELWQLATLIVHRRVLKLIRSETRKRRPRPVAASDSQIEKASPPRRPRIPDDENDPAWLAIAMDNLRQMFQALPREDLRQVALLRMSGFSVQEIADRLGVVRRTAERKLNLIRLCWSRYL